MPRHYRLSWFQKVGHGYWFHSYKNEDNKWTKKYFQRGSSKHGDLEAYRTSVKEYDAWNQEGPEPRKSTAQRKSYSTTSRSGWRPKTSVEGLYDRYVSELYSRALHAEDIVGRVACLQVAFKRFIKPRKQGGFLRGHQHPTYEGLHSISGLTDKTVIGFAKFMLREVKEGKIKPITANRYLNHIKRFAQFCFERRWIHDYRLPTDISIPTKAQPNEILIYSMEELQALYKVVDKRMRLMLILALNTGYTSSDLADIRLQNIQFNQAGKPERILKLRTKTSEPQNHILWTKTSELLLDWIDDNKIENMNQLIFINRNGNPLVRNVVKMKRQADGTRKQSGSHLDGISEHFRTLTKSLKEEGTLRKKLTFKHLRKTGGTQIYSECRKSPGVDHLLIEQIFYSHKPISVARQYYTKLDRTILDPYLLEAEKFFSNIWLDDDGQ